jgi:hypothetical protein
MKMLKNIGATVSIIGVVGCGESKTADKDEREGVYQSIR